MTFSESLPPLSIRRLFLIFKALFYNCLKYLIQLFFLGNGKLGFGLDNDKKLFYLKTETHGYIESFVPTLNYKIHESHSVEEKAVIMNLKAGLVILATVLDVVSSKFLQVTGFHIFAAVLLD